MIDINSDKELKAFMKENETCIISFHGRYCNPCKTQKEELEKLEGVPIARIEGDSNPTICEEYMVRSIPATFIVRDNEIQESIVGLCRLKVLKEKLNNF